MANDHRLAPPPLSDLDIQLEEERIRHVVAMVEQTQRDRDPAGFMRLLCPDTTWVTALGRTLSGWEEINAFTHRVLTPSIGDKYAAYEVVGVKFLSATVAAVNVWQRPIDADGNPDLDETEGRPLYVMVKKGSDWRISVAQNTQVAAELIDRQQRAIEEVDNRLAAPGQ